MKNEKYTETLEFWVLALMIVMEHHPKAWEDFQRLYPKTANEISMWRQTYVLNLEDQINTNRGK